MSNRKLLLADDSITIQKVVNLTFADEGIEVITVGDGDAAMEKFAEFTPDLVMADVNMPGLNGYEICEIIKRNESTSRIPVILLVGSFEPFDEEEATRVGANDFLTKPFQSIRQLVGKVTDLLNNRETETIAEESTEESSEPILEDFSDDHETPAQKPTGFTATLEMPRQELASAVDLGDTGMDDEMIETSQVGGVSEEESYESEPAEDNLKTQALTADDMREYGFTRESETVEETAEESDFEAETSDNFVEEEPETRETEVEEALQTQESGFDESEETQETETEQSFTEGSGEDLAEEKGFGIVSDEFQAPETDAEFSEETEETESAEESSQFEEPETVSEEETEPSEAEFEEESETPSMETSESEEMQESEVSEPQQSSETEPEVSMTEEVAPMSFDDADLLELPPLVEETGIRPPSETVKPEPEVQEETEEPPVVEEQPEPAKTLSPELIEAIANRVTEKLLDKVMKSLNTEIVPEVAEQIIKEMAEDDLQQ